jgi:hypothetical protein
MLDAALALGWRLLARGYRSSRSLRSGWSEARGHDGAKGSVEGGPLCDPLWIHHQGKMARMHPVNVPSSDSMK